MTALEQLNEFKIKFCNGSYWCIVREFDGSLILSGIPTKEKAERIIEVVKGVIEE